MPDPKMTPAETPEPLTLAVVVEYEDGDYCAQIVGSNIFGDGKTPATALASLAAACCAVEGRESEAMLRRFAKAAKEERQDALASKLKSNLAPRSMGKRFTK